MKRTVIALALGALVAGAVLAPAGQAVAAKGAKVVGTDPAGDWGGGAEAGAVGSGLGQDLVSASLGMRDKKTINFVLKVTALPPIGGTPEATRYWWDFSVGKKVLEIDGKFTNFSRGACDPTAGSCPPPRNPGLAPFVVRGNCHPDPNASNVIVCEEVGLVNAEFDAAKGTITVPVPLKMIGAKPGSKIGPASALSTVGGQITAAPAAFVTNASMPMDTMIAPKTFTIPKK